MKKFITVLFAASSLILFSCGEDNSKQIEKINQPQEQTKKKEKSNIDLNNKGIGPIKEIKLDEKIDQEMVKKGATIYLNKCKSCHKEYKEYVGPPPAGILKRRSPEWIMNMILNPEEMVKKDPIAKELFKKYIKPMADQNLTKEEARYILEYFRTLKEK